MPFIQLNKEDMDRAFSSYHEKVKNNPKYRLDMLHRIGALDKESYNKLVAILENREKINDV